METKENSLQPFITKPVMATSPAERLGRVVGVFVMVFVGELVGVMVVLFVGVFEGLLVGEFVAVLVIRGVLVGIPGVFVAVLLGLLVALLLGVFVGELVGLWVAVGVDEPEGFGVKVGPDTAMPFQPTCPEQAAVPIPLTRANPPLLTFPSAPQLLGFTILANAPVWQERSVF